MSPIRRLVVQLSLFSICSLFLISVSSSFANSNETHNNNSNIERSNEQVNVRASHSNFGSKQSAAKQFIVQFDEKPMATYKREMLQTSQRNKSIMTSAQKQQRTVRHENAILDKHQKFESNVKRAQPLAKIEKRFSTLLNGVIVETTLSAKALKQIDGVKNVFPVQRYKAKLSNVLPVIEADDAWELLGGREDAGQGIRIAVIDSGIIPTHPMFDDTNMTAPSSDLPTDDYCRQEQASFCNNKLIVARHYVPSFINIDNEGEYDSPLALSGHGVHVAGIATGRQVTADNGDVISGVAPGAYLMAYKALWGQDGQGSDAGLLQAIEDAYNDGADVINNSWGGETGGSPANTVYQEIYQELEENGVVVVSAAGNEGEDATGEPVESSISCPACIEAGITVGATTTDLIYGLPIQYDDNSVYAQPSDNYSINSAISAGAEVAPTSNTLGCSAWQDNALTNKIAIVNRGTCFFEEKANLAQDAGAVGLIVINNVIEANITMSMGSATLPSLLISKSDGLILTEYLSQNSDVELVMETDLVVASEPARQDAIASFSSLGPNGDSSFIKPDVSAPGVSILSATSPEDNSSLGNDYTRLNGTSMASPVVAGAAALLKQHESGFSAKQIKNIIINSSNPVVQNLLEERSATPFEAGAGRLNVVDALNASAYAETANMAKQYCVLSCSIDNQLVSVSDQTSVWTASIEFDNSAIVGEVFPNQITLSSPQQSVAFEAQISVPRTYQTDWYFGRLIWTSDSGETINQAIAINNEVQVSELLQAELAEESQGQRQLTLTSLNVTSEQEVDIALALQGGATFDTNSLDVETSGSYTLDTQTDSAIEITAQLPLGSAEFVSGTSPIEVDLVAEGIDPISCEFEGCDEVLYEIDFDFIHYGTNYSQFMMSENGYIIAGNESVIGALLHFNTSFPTDSQPNNVIAPFWSDFNLINPLEPEDTGGGHLIIQLYSSNGTKYMVLQWSNVQLYTDSQVTPTVLGVSRADLEFSFQLILQENSENKWFRYLDIPEQPNFYSVGVENSAGTQGFTYWFDGAGESAVNDNDSLALSLANLGELTLTADIDRSMNSDFTVDDSYQVTAGISSELNVLGNDLLSSGEANLQITVNEIEQVLDVFLAGNDVSIDQTSLLITSQPQNGVATALSSGLIRYVANSDFTGQDSFTYQVDNSLDESSSATVIIEVQASTATGDVFGVELTGESSINAGTSQVYNAVVTNSSEDVTYNWILPSGLSATNTTAASITVTADSGEQDTNVVLSVEVTSAGTRVTDTLAITVVALTGDEPEPEEDEDKGFFGLPLNESLLLSLMLLVLGRRFTAFRKA